MTFPSNPETIVILFVVFSAAVSSLPPPRDDSGPLYEWFYKFSNSLAANVNALRGKAQYEPKMQVVAAESTASTVTVSQAKDPPQGATQ